MMIEVSLLQPLKAFTPISVILFGILTDVTSGLPENAPIIEVTLYVCLLVVTVEGIEIENPYRVHHVQ